MYNVSRHQCGDAMYLCIYLGGHGDPGMWTHSDVWSSKYNDSNTVYQPKEDRIPQSRHRNSNYDDWHSKYGDSSLRCDISWDDKNSNCDDSWYKNEDWNSRILSISKDDAIYNRNPKCDHPRSKHEYPNPNHAVIGICIRAKYVK